MHQQTPACPFASFQALASPSQNSMEDASMSFLQPASPNTIHLNGDMQVCDIVCQHLKAETYNKQQQLSGCISVQQIMTRQKTRTYNGPDNSNNNRLKSAMVQGIPQMIYDAEPKAADDREESEFTSIIKNVCNETTIPEIDSNDLTEYLQNIEQNVMKREVESNASGLIGTGCQTDLNLLHPQCNIVTFINQEEGDVTPLVLMQSDNIVPTAPIVQANPVGQLLKVDTYNNQQQLSGCMSVQQIMAKQKTRTYNDSDNSNNNRLNSAVVQGLSRMFPHDKPVVPDMLQEFDLDEVMEMLERTELSEMLKRTELSEESPSTFKDQENQPPVHDPTASGLSETSNVFCPEGEGTLDTNFMNMEVENASGLIGTGCQTGLNLLPPQCNNVTFINQGVYNTHKEEGNFRAPVLMQSDNIIPSAPMDKVNVTATAPIEKEKRKEKGDITATVLKHQEKKAFKKKNDSQSNLKKSCKVSLEQSSKTNSRKKTRRSVSEESVSEPKFSSVGAKGSDNKMKRGLQGFELDTDYEEATCSSSTLSPTPLTDIHAEDLDQKRRRKNNEASRISRRKRKELDKLTEKRCKAELARNQYLRSLAAKYEKAVEMLYYCIISANNMVNLEGLKL